MRLSGLFFKSYREPPSNVISRAHEFLFRAGYLKQFGGENGIAFFPLGVLFFKNVRKKILLELKRTFFCQEIFLPDTETSKMSGFPFETLVQRSGIDVSSREMHLTFEFIDASGDFVPDRLLRFQMARCLGGVSIYPDVTSATQSFDSIVSTIQRGISILGMESVVIERPGAMKISGIFLRSEHGNSYYLTCDRCGYIAERAVADFRMEDFPEDAGGDLMTVETPGKTTIQDVADFMDVSASETLKALMYDNNGRLSVLMLPGDREASEEKIKTILKVDKLIPASEHLQVQHGVIPGYASLLGVGDNVQKYVDKRVSLHKSYVCGANMKGYHCKNVQPGRDFPAFHCVDIAKARTGDKCPRCEDGTLRENAGIRIAIIRQSASTDRPPHRIQSGIIAWKVNMNALLASIAETYSDKAGLTLPVGIAPFDVHLIALSSTDEEVMRRAEMLYGELKMAGVQVLFDDRDASAGVKFNDADLIGCPLRVTVGKRGIKSGKLEMKNRRSGEMEWAPVHLAAGYIQAYLQTLELSQTPK